VYDATITILNISRYTKKVRLTRQPSAEFELKYMKVDKLAPGMSLIIKLRFEPKQNKD